MFYFVLIAIRVKYKQAGCKWFRVIGYPVDCGGQGAQPCRERNQGLTTHLPELALYICLLHVESNTSYLGDRVSWDTRLCRWVSEWLTGVSEERSTFETSGSTHRTKQ